MSAPQIILDMPMADYLSHPGYGSSDLRTFLAGPPAMVPWSRENRHDDTDATILGRAAHLRILQPDLFVKVYAFKPASMKFSTTEGKEWKAQQLANGIAEEDILTDATARAVFEIESAFRHKSLALQVLTEAMACNAVENTLTWTDENDLPRKSRPDLWVKDATIDLKVSVHATKDLSMLKYQCFKQGWLHQAANARAGLRACGKDSVKTGRLIVIAPEPPQEFRVWLLEIPEHEMDVLDLDLDNISRDMVPHHRANVWPGSPETWIPLTLPSDHMLADLVDATAAAEEVTS